VSELETPLRNVLARAVTDRDTRRIWAGIAASREARFERGPVWRAAFAGAALATLLLLGLRLATGGGSGKGLTLADGRDLVALEAPPAVRDEVALADRSRLARDAGVRLHVLENTASVVDMLLESGRVHLHVEKGGQRRWIVECGLLSAEVVGTDFVVERDPGHARVDVLEGVVLVRGDRVQNRVKRLGAGESLEVLAEGAVSAAARESEPTPPPRLAPSSAPTASPVASARAGEGLPVESPTAAASSGASTWRELAGKAAYGRAYETLGEGGIAKSTVGATVDVLLELADVARLSGHPGEAIAPLTEIADRHGDDPRSSLAAFTLGRVLLDRAPALATHRFEQALARGLPMSLVEDAMAHVVDARARAGDRQGALEAAARYEAAYPSGRHRASVRLWAGER
jgi:transmembrane sensor